MKRATITMPKIVCVLLRVCRGQHVNERRHLVEGKQMQSPTLFGPKLEPEPNPEPDPGYVPPENGPNLKGEEEGGPT